jgi:hypothetical protein
MNMIVAKGFDLDRERQTFECLRCGRTEPPSNPMKRAARLFAPNPDIGLFRLGCVRNRT